MRSVCVGAGVLGSVGVSSTISKRRRLLECQRVLLLSTLGVMSRDVMNGGRGVACRQRAAVLCFAECGPSKLLMLLLFGRWPGLGVSI